MAMTAHTPTLNQVGKQGEHRRWIPFGSRRLANRQTDLALCMGHAGQAVTQHQDVLALVTEILGNHMRHVRGLEAQHGRHVGRCRNHHRLSQTLFAQRLVDKGLHFAATFTNQTNHHDVGLGKARQHAQQHTLAHARTRHQANALATANRQGAVDGFHAHIQNIHDGAPLHGV